MDATFTIKGIEFSASGVLGVKQISEDKVKVTWAQKSVIIDGTTVSEVMSAIEKAKGIHR